LSIQFATVTLHCLSFGDKLPSRSLSGQVKFLVITVVTCSCLKLARLWSPKLNTANNIRSEALAMGSLFTKKHF